LGQEVGGDVNDRTVASGVVDGAGGNGEDFARKTVQADEGTAIAARFQMGYLPKMDTVLGVQQGGCAQAQADGV